MFETASILAALLAGARETLGSQFVGLYLHGSLANGSFDPQSSDIDFMIVTDGDVPAAQIPALRAMHDRLWASGDPWAMKLEGDYIPQAAMRRFTPEDPPRLHVFEGRFFLDEPSANQVFQRHILREQGLVISGPPLREMMDAIDGDTLRDAVRDNLREWWLPMLDNPERMASSEYQAFAVLTMCRSLYTLEHGDVASKPGASAWAQQTLAEPWPGLIVEAAAWRHGATMDRLTDVLAFLRYTAVVAGVLVENSRGA